MFGHRYFGSRHFGPRYFGGGGSGSSSTPATSGSTTLPHHTRLYSAAGTRLYFDDTWIQNLNFEVLERGGYGTGSLTALASWADMQLTGTEYFDVYLFGTLMYRGFVRTPGNELTDPERATLGLFGLMEQLGAYRSRCRFAYGVETDLSAVFRSIVEKHVKIAGRLPNIVIDDQTIGVTIRAFDATGKSVAEALNALCDLAPSQAIWGCDVTSGLLDRIYIRPKSSTVTQWYSVGTTGERSVDAYVYPKDIAAIVNSLVIEGGAAAQPNLIRNGSFEEPIPFSETIGNLLSDYSFESPAAAWTLAGGASIKQTGGGPTAVGAPHTGEWWLELDQAGETAKQTVSINYLMTYAVSFWVRYEHATNSVGRTFTLTLEGLDAGSSVVTTQNYFAGYDPGSATYRKYALSVSWDLFPTVTQVRLTLQSHAGAANNDGLIFDDVAIYELTGVANSGWEYALAGAATRVQIDWVHDTDFEAFHGCWSVKAQAAGTATSADYMEIRTSQNARPPIRAGQRYTVIWRYRSPNIGTLVDFSIGAVQYKADGTVAATAESSTHSSGVTDWSISTHSFTADSNAQTAAVFWRVRDTDIVYLDAAMLIEGEVPAQMIDTDGQPAYWDADKYQAEIAADNTSLSLDTDAAASITTYGERQAAESRDNVTDWESAKAFATGYFNAHAVPREQARMDMQLENDRELLFVDGRVRLLNIASGPPDLFPSVIRYQVDGAGLRMSADLGNERPSEAVLLRLMQARARRGL